MNKEFNFYWSKIEKKLKKHFKKWFEDEPFDKTISSFTDIKTKVLEFYEKYKDTYKFDDLLNINATYCDYSICCINCYCCSYCLLCEKSEGCDNMFKCSDCDGCDWCKYCQKCKHCSGCEKCDSCDSCVTCDFCEKCEICDNCQNLKNCKEYIENHVETDEYDFIDLSKTNIVKFGNKTMKIHIAK